MEILNAREILHYLYCSCSNQYRNNQEYVKSPPAVTCPKSKSPNHPKILHVQVANNQVRIPQEKHDTIKVPVSSYHRDKLLLGTFKLKPDFDFRRFKRENTYQE